MDKQMTQIKQTNGVIVSRDLCDKYGVPFVEEVAQRSIVFNSELATLIATRCPDASEEDQRQVIFDFVIKMYKKGLSVYRGLN